MAGHYQNTVEDLVTGKPVNGATIKVYQDGATLSADGRSVSSGTLATIYSDDGVTTIDQTNAPLTTGQDGEFDFYTDQSRVDIAISYNGEGKAVWRDTDILGGTVSGDITALAARVDKHDTVFGLSASAVDLGTFTGSTISDNTDVVGALQELETAVEAGSGAYTPGGTDVAIADGGTGASTAAGARTNLGIAWPTWDFNFADAGDQYIRANVAMTITEQDTTGTGTVAYEKSTAAAPDTFSSATSPITLEAGAKLKVTASSVTATFAVHLERTA